MAFRTTGATAVLAILVIAALLNVAAAADSTQLETITMPAPPEDAGFEYSWETRKGKKNNKDVLVVGPVVKGVKENNGKGNGGKKAVDAASAQAEAKKKDPQLETITMPAPPADAGFEYSWETRKGKKDQKDVLVVGPVVTGVKGQGKGAGNGGKKAVDAATAEAEGKKKEGQQLETITMPAPPADAGFEFSWETRKGKKNNKDVLVVGPVVTGVKESNGKGSGGKKAVDAASAQAEAKKKDPQLETITMPAPPADAGFEYSWETRKGKKDQKDVLVVGPVVTGFKDNNDKGNGKKSEDGSVVPASSDVAPAASGVSSGVIGIAVGAGVVLAAAVGAAVMVHRRRSRKAYGSVEAAITPTEVQPDRVVLNQH
ncbi:hypothetical protein GGF31_005014 [Allomyces arbusculus]|nr:hypothetical protein GGF31_005014 [Allomyces arbusculus]